MVMRGAENGQRSFRYMDESGRSTDLGEAPLESVEMQRVMDLELERYAPDGNN
jgi:hypothetical protein